MRILTRLSGAFMLLVCLSSSILSANSLLGFSTVETATTYVTTVEALDAYVCAEADPDNMTAEELNVFLKNAEATGALVMSYTCLEIQASVADHRAGCSAGDPFECNALPFWENLWENQCGGGFILSSSITGQVFNPYSGPTYGTNCYNGCGCVDSGGDDDSTNDPNATPCIGGAICFAPRVCVDGFCVLQ